MRLALVGCILLFAGTAAWAREGSMPQQALTVQPPQTFVLENAELHLPGGKRRRGTLLIRDGRIAAIDGAAPADAERIDLGGKAVLPGFIDAASSFGAPTTPCRRESAEGSTANPPPGRGRFPGAGQASTRIDPAPRHWNPRVCPERDLAHEVRLDAEAAAGWRAAGFTTLRVLPGQGNLRGQSVLLDLALSDASREAVITAPWVRPAQVVGLEPVMSFGGDYPGSTMGALALIRQALHDAGWYSRALARGKLVESNPALAALAPVLAGRQVLLLEARNELDLARARKLAEEFGIDVQVVGTTNDYREAAHLDLGKLALIVPLNFPKAPPAGDPGKALELSQADLEQWRFAPMNPALLARAGARFALTARGLDKPEAFLPAVREAVRHGLSEAEALAALTERPAALLGAADRLGALRAGAVANLLIADPELLRDDKARLYETWVEGRRQVHRALDAPVLAGSHVLARGDATATLVVEATDRGKVTLAGADVSPIRRETGLLIGLSAPVLGLDQVSGVMLELVASRKGPVARLLFPDGRREILAITATAALETSADDTGKPDRRLPVPELPARLPYPAGEYGRVAPPPQPEHLLIRGATVWMADLGTPLADTDVLVRRGKIVAVGQGLTAPAGAEVVLATGKHLTPGLIDAHSHIAIDGNVNEPSHTITSEVRIGDVLNPADINLYRQLAGGLTTAQLLHGSANTIGGQSQLIKLRWGESAEGLKFAAIPTIKFALGENPKQSNWGDAAVTRYPQTRMGVEQIVEDAFLQAQAYAERRRKDKDSRVDLRMEALVEVLEGRRLIHVHSYRADEILAFGRLMQRFGIRIAAFQHVLEGYKVAPEIAGIDAGASTFADWWAFKLEVYDAIPHNAALLTRAGVLTSLNSDSPDLARRLNTEAAKAVRYGGLSESEALALVTVNPARQLRIDDRVGRIAPGLDGDLVLWSGHPLSTLSRVEGTWIEGRRYFDAREDQALQAAAQATRARLLADAAKAGSEAPAGKGEGGPPRLFDRLAGMRQVPAALLPLRGLYHDGEPVHLCLGHP